MIGEEEIYSDFVPEGPIDINQPPPLVDLSEVSKQAEQAWDLSVDTDLDISMIEQDRDTFLSKPLTSKPSPVPMWGGTVPTYITMKGITFKPAGERPFAIEAKAAIRQSLDRVTADQWLGDAVLNRQGVGEAYKHWRAIQQQEPAIDAESSRVRRIVLQNLAVAAPMLKSYAEAGWGAAFGGATGFAIAAIAGFFIPAPEEVVTIPAAVTVGAKAGAVVTGVKGGLAIKTAEFWYRQGVGMFYGEMLDSGVDPKVGGVVASIGAIPYAAIEFSQMRQLTPGMRKGAQQTLMRSVTRTIAEISERYAHTLSWQIAEEDLQEIVNIGAVDLATYLSGMGLDIDKDALVKRGRRILDTTVVSAESMLLLPVGNAVADIASGIPRSQPSGATSLEEVAQVYNDRIKEAQERNDTAEVEALKTVEQYELSQLGIRPKGELEAERADMLRERAEDRAIIESIQKEEVPGVTPALQKAIAERQQMAREARKELEAPITPKEEPIVAPAEAKEALQVRAKELYRQIAETEGAKRTLLEEEQIKITDKLNQLILEEFDPIAAKIKQPWQITSGEIKVPGGVRTIPKAGDLGGGLRLAIPSTRTPGAWQVSSISVDRFIGKAVPFTHVEFETKEGALAYLKNIHKNEVREAVSQGKPVPFAVLEEYKSEEWAQEALTQPTPEAKVGEKVYYTLPASGKIKQLYVAGKKGESLNLIPLNKISEFKKEGYYPGIWVNKDSVSIEKPAPEAKPIEPKKPGVSLLGGVPVKPPGLTRAEIQHLGAPQQTALRAAQEKGLSVGYKKGVADTATNARRSLDAIRLKGKLDEKTRMDAANIVLTYAPKEKQGDYIRRVLTANTAKRIDRITEAINTYIQRAEKRQAKNDFKKFISQTRREYRKGEVAFGKLPIALRERIKTVLDEYDTAKLTEKKAKQLESRDEFVKRISRELADGFEAMNPEYDEDAKDLLVMGRARIEELTRLSKTPIGELDAEQIKYIHASLQHLIDVNERVGDSKVRMRLEELGTHLNNARQEVLPEKEMIKYLTGMPKGVRWITVEGQASLQTLAHITTKLDAPSTRTLLRDNLEQSNQVRKTKLREFVETFRDKAAEKGVTWNHVKQLWDRVDVTIGGKQVNLTKADLLSIYAHTQADGNLERLLKTKGLDITTYRRDKMGVLVKQQIYLTGTPTLAELRAISETVSDEHKALLETHFETNREVQALAINETSMQMLNYEVADPSRKYFHVSRVREQRLEGTRAETARSIDMAGRYQPRTGGDRRIAIRPFHMEVIHGMQQDATYHAMAMPLQDAVSLVANPKWRMAMKKAGNERALTEMTTMMRRIQGLTSDQSVFEQETSRWLAGTAKSLLSARVSGGLVQTASIPAAFEVIEAKYFYNLKPTTPKDIRHLKEISSTLWLRWEGKQFDYATGLIGSQHAFESLIFGKTPVTDKLLMPYTWGDQMAIGKLWHAAQNKVAGQTKLKRGSKEFETKSLGILHEALQTQPQWDILYRSSLTSHPNPFVRGFTMFMSARNAQYNVLLRALNDAHVGRINEKEFEARIGGVVAANIAVSMSRRLFRVAVRTGTLGLLVAVGSGPDEPVKEIAEQTLNQLGKVPQESIFNMVGLNAFGGVLTSIGYAAIERQKKGAWQKADLSRIRTGNMIGDLMLDASELGIDFTQLTHEYLNDDPNWKDTAEEVTDLLAQLIAYRYGLPWEGPKSDLIWPITGAIRQAEGKRGEIQRKIDTRIKRLKEPPKIKLP